MYSNPEDRKTYTLGEIVDVAQGFAVNSKTNHLIGDSGLPLLRITDLLNNQQVQFIDPNKIPSQFIANDNELIYTRTGQVGYVFKNKVGVVHNNCFKVIPKDNIVDKDFLYWFLSQQSIREHANSIASGSVQKDLPHAAFKSIEIEVPSIYIQHRIADILSSLDDKIEVNRRMNATLESMARAVFRQWFVENEEVGDWEEVPLPEIIEVNPARSLKKGDVAPYLDMANMPTQGHRGIEWINRPFGSGTKFINGDTLLARITPCLENGKTALVDFLKDGQVGWGSTEYIVLHPKPPLSPEYGYYLARSEELRNHAIQNMTGTSGRQRTPASCFDSFMVVKPPDELARKFGEFAGSVIEMVRANDEESRTLGSLRDSLLPKLMRGEVRVKE